MPFTTLAARKCPFERVPIQSRLNMSVVSNIDGVIDSKKWMVVHREVDNHDCNSDQKAQKELGCLPGCKPSRLRLRLSFWLGDQTSRRHSSSRVICAIGANSTAAFLMFVTFSRMAGILDLLGLRGRQMTYTLA